MLKSRIVYSFIVLFSLISLACKEDRPIQGFEQVDPNDTGTVSRKTITTLEFEDSFQDTVSASGARSILSVGAVEDMEARILMKFGNVPDTALITNVALLLRTSGIVGDEAAQSFEATMHQVTTAWEESTVTAENFNFQSAIISTPIASTELLPIEVVTDTTDTLVFTETVRFDFNQQGVELVREWADSNSTVNNFGILIDFAPGSGFIKEFFSRNSSSNVPILELQVMSGGQRDTTGVFATADAAIVSRLAQPPPGPMYVDNIFGHQSVFKFDLSEIPRESTINRASLELHIQGENTILTNRGFTARLDILSEAFIPPKTFELDSTFDTILFNINDPDEPVTIPIRGLLQAWVSDIVENHGILIRTAVPGLDVSRVALESNMTNPGVAPKLKIDFSTAPPVQ